MNREKLEPSCSNIWKHLINSNFIFQHDSDPKVTVSAVKAWLDRNMHNEPQSCGYANSSRALGKSNTVMAGRRRRTRLIVNVLIA